MARPLVFHLLALDIDGACRAVDEPARGMHIVQPIAVGYNALGGDRVEELGLER